MHKDNNYSLETHMEPRLITSLARLSPYPSTNNNLPSLTHIYCFESPPEDKRGLGSFMIAAEVMAKRQLAGSIIDLIIKTLGDVYYNEDSGEIIDERFEKALTKVNRNIQDLTNKEEADLEGKISAVAAILSDDILRVAACGNAKAYLYRKDQTIDITEGLDGDNNEDKKKLFNNVATGRLEEKDKILLASPALFFHFQKKELQQLICDNSPNYAVQKLASLIGNDENASRFGAIIAEVISPETASAQTLPEEKTVAMVGTPPSLTKDARNLTQPIATKLAKKTGQVANDVKSWSKEKLVPSVKEKSKSGWNTLWTKYINPNPRLALGVAAAILVIFIGFSIYLSQRPSNISAKLVTLREAIALTDTAEAKLSLNKRDEAAEAIASADKKLELISQKPTEIAAINNAAKRDPDLKGKSITVESLKQRIEAIEDKLANLSRIKPEEVYDFKSIKNAKINIVAYLGDNLYAVNSNDGSLYNIKPPDKSANKVDSNENLKSAISATTGSNGDVIYFLTSTPAVMQYKPGGSLKETQLSAGEWPSGDDIASYIGNLYILSKEDDQIWKHTPTAIGYSSRNGWLETSTHDEKMVDGAVSLVVNGNIFTITKQNELKMFAGGQQKDFKTKDLPKNLGEPAKMILNTDKNQLYVLCPNTRKVYRLNLSEEGAVFDKQYVISGVSTIKSFALDQAKSAIYIAADNKVVKFTP